MLVLLGVQLKINLRKSKHVNFELEVKNELKPFQSFKVVIISTLEGQSRVFITRILTASLALLFSTYCGLMEAQPIIYFCMILARGNASPTKAKRFTS